MITAFANQVERVTDFFGKLTWYCTLLMVVTGAYNATLRSLSGWAHIDPSNASNFQKILQWIGEIAKQGSSNTFIELQWYLFSIVFLMGASYALKTDAHVRVDIFYNRLSLTAKTWTNIIGTLVFLLPFCILMIWTSWPAVVDSWIRLEGSPDPGGLPRYPLLTVIPFAFILLMAQGLAFAAREALQLFDLAEQKHRDRP
ncbi:MAG: TRAP transporter small permease subunit [Bacteroidetes bacterium]|nr:TRAP transporter small permease subunit [Bacteroidota bacterium]MCY4206245.1 TRAP transporter small permease subunit [Bacteroidota bacterium]